MTFEEFWKQSGWKETGTSEYNLAIDAYDAGRNATGCAREQSTTQYCAESMELATKHLAFRKQVRTELDGLRTGWDYHKLEGTLTLREEAYNSFVGKMTSELSAAMARLGLKEERE